MAESAEVVSVKFGKVLLIDLEALYALPFFIILLNTDVAIGWQYTF